jgi:hypothetical protein
MLAALVWCIYFYFARHSSYAGDDFGIIRAVLQGGLRQSLHLNIRPLEYFFDKLSSLTGEPIWLLASFGAFTATSSATLALMNVVEPDAEPRAWKLMLCASSPLASQAYFQVDTVSQALANLFTVLFAVECLRCYRPSDNLPAARDAWRAAALGLLCLLSKETSWGVIVVGSMLLLARHRSRVLVPVGGLLLLFAGCIAWSLTQTGAVQGTHYGIKANPLYWIFTVIFSTGVALAPIPTSLVLTGAWSANPSLIALIVVGALVGLVGIALFAPRILASFGTAWHALLNTVRTAELTNGQIIAIFALASLVPSVFIKAGELYASEMLPFLKCLLVIAMASKPRPLERIFLPIVCSFWVLASIVNLSFYSIVSGYEPNADRAHRSGAENWFYETIQDGVNHRSRDYSIYSYREAALRERHGSCLIDNTEPSVCIPESISSGFPILRTQN